MEYCCHIWAVATWCYLELLDMLQKINILDCTCCFSRTPSSLSKCGQLKSFLSSELAQLIPLPFSTCYYDRLHDFSVTILRCYKDVYVNSFFPRTAKLRNSLHIECFPLTYNLNGLKSRINRHLLTVGYF